MGVQSNPKNAITCYLMLGITLLIIATVVIYLSYFPTTEEALRSDKNIITLTGPWKFKVRDNIQFAQSSYNDSAWQTISLAAPHGAHDDDVGLSGYIPGWTANGYPTYSGYAWYRLNVSMDSIPGNSLALAAPTAVDDAYQLYINGSLAGSAGNFNDRVPVLYSIQPRMFLLPDNVKSQKNITIAFRVWMSAASLSAGSGGIHIAPAIGEKTHIETKYRFQWTQTIKGYIVEVALPIMFVLLAITIFLLNKNRQPTQLSKWFITALILVGLMRLNQAVYFWFQIENRHLSSLIGPVILRSLVLGSWLMAWREWFNLHQPKWMPKVIALLSLLYLVTQWLSLSSVSTAIDFPAIASYTRWLMLIVMLFILYQGMRIQGMKDNILVLLAALVMTIALFPNEISALHVIPGIWFPYGVGVSRGQFFYAAFVLLMYVVLIRKNRREELV